MFGTHLSLRDVPQGLDQVEFLLAGTLLDHLHRALDHLLHGLSELTVLLGENLQVRIDLGRVVRGVEEVDDADQEARSRGEIRGLDQFRGAKSARFGR